MAGQSMKNFNGQTRKRVRQKATPSILNLAAHRRTGGRNLSC